MEWLHDEKNYSGDHWVSQQQAIKAHDGIVKSWKPELIETGIDTPIWHYSSCRLSGLYLQ